MERVHTARSSFIFLSKSQSQKYNSKGNFTLLRLVSYGPELFFLFYIFWVLYSLRHLSSCDLNYCLHYWVGCKRLWKWKFVTVKCMGIHPWLSFKQSGNRKLFTPSYFPIILLRSDQKVSFHWVQLHAPIQESIRRRPGDASMMRVTEWTVVLPLQVETRDVPSYCLMIDGKPWYYDIISSGIFSIVSILLVSLKSTRKQQIGNEFLSQWRKTLQFYATKMCRCQRGKSFHGRSAWRDMWDSCEWAYVRKRNS